MRKHEVSSTQQEPAVHIVKEEERRARGKALRDTVPRKVQAIWEAPRGRPDPVTLLKRSNLGRIPELIPIRYGRMMSSPFAFFRGSAALMAADLANTPTTGIKVQACGDCHLLNFGAYATPERRIIVDINDFDETLPAPWEWDLKRLGTSFVLACRSNGFKPAVCRDAAETVARSYREAMLELSKMRVLDVWYSKLDLETYIAGVEDKDFRQGVIANIERQKQKSIVDYYVPKLTALQDGRQVIRDAPPLVYHSDEQRSEEFARVAWETFQNYKRTLSNERQVLLSRYELQDVAMKIVGIGSVGTYCAVLLLLARPDDPLILQIKQVQASVLEPYAGQSVYGHHGQRVVNGQRLMQAHGDIFLGWATGAGQYQRHFYLRQLRDMKMSPVPETWTSQRAMEVARDLGWVLARAHARSGDATMISGYLGAKDVFDRAAAQFSIEYADQSERDYQSLIQAVKSGRLEAYLER
jgi:uncharacterized protein (DUF2252 family)